MRHLRNILPALLTAALISIACTKVQEYDGPGKGRVTLKMSCLGMRPSSKAFSEQASLGSLTVIVFDESGCYVESAAAQSLTPGQGTDGLETSFEATLTATSNPVALHLVANYDTGNIPFGLEGELLGTMTTSSGQEAYWQRVSLPGGIPSDGTTPAALKRMPLVRNFASVTVTDEAEGFTMTGYALTNMPDRGSVAPHTENGGFAPFSGETCPSYQILNASGYHGWTPAGAQLTNNAETGFAFGNQTIYTYEHPYTANKDTYSCLLIKGHKGSSATDVYYKVDLIRPLTGGRVEYYDIIRNIAYNVTITSVSGAGYATPGEAMSSPAGNNLSGSITTDEMSNISDGVGQLFVSDTSLEFVTSDPLVLKYKWVPDLVNASSVTRNDLVTVDAPAGAVLSTAGVRASSDTDGWRSVTLTPNAIGALSRSQDITLSTNTGLTKTIHLNLRPKYNMTVSVNPTTVPATAGASLDIQVTIPAGIGRSAFPLEFMVGSDANTIYPDPSAESMPVIIKTPYYGFKKNVNWGDYETVSERDGHYIFTCHMLTNKDESATTVRVREYHFNDGTYSFINQL